MLRLSVGSIRCPRREMRKGIGDAMTALNNSKYMMNSSQSFHVKFPGCRSDKESMAAGKGHHCPALFLLYGKCPDVRGFF
jgi:hypothetical protein